MMNLVFTGLIVLAVVFGLLTGRMGQVSNAALGGCAKAVELFLTVLGTVCLWNGVMKVASKAGLTGKLAKLLFPVTRRLFRDVEPGSPASQAISMNIIANLLGLGNAATPLGILAMKEMQAQNPEKARATDSMVTFVVLNTASIQLIPATTAALRMAAGSAAPLDILPCVWLSSAVTLCAAMSMAQLLRRWFPGRAMPAGLPHKAGRCMR